MSNRSSPEKKRSDAGDTDHLDGIESGAGCTEIWERLSEQRENTPHPAPVDD